MHKKIFYYLSSYYQLFLVTIILWCVLNESFRTYILIESVVIAFLTCTLIHLLLGKDNHYANHNGISLLTAIRFVVVLIISIYKSAFDVIRIIFTDNPTPKFIKFKTDTEDEWARCLIANSITLTPGTVSINDDDKELTVLWIKPTTADKREYADIIQGPFEKVFKKR